jgi:PAS domain S-box-containing protein
MSDRSAPRMVTRLSIFSATAAVFSVIVGMTGLVGWKLRIASLTSWGAAPVTMKANTSLCFVLLGASLWLLRKKHTGSFAWILKSFAQAAAAAAGLLGLFSLVEFISAWDLRIDQLLVLSPLGSEADSPRPGLMSPVTAGAFLLLGIALLGVDWRTRSGQWPAQALSLAAGMAAMFGLLSFAFDPRIYIAHLSMALPTAITMMIISFAVVCSRTEIGLGALLCSRSLGGGLARRLLPAAFVPVLVGWIRWQITDTQLFSEWSIVVVSSLATMFLLATIIAWAAAAVDRNDEERKQAERQLADQSEELLHSQHAMKAQKLMLQSVLDSMQEGLVAVDETGRFIIWNPAAAKMLGLGAANLPSAEWTAHYGLFLEDTVTPFPSDQLPLVRAIRGESSTAQMFVRNPELDHGTWIEVGGGPLKDSDGAIRGGVVAFRDITQRRADEREILKLNEELEARVAQRTAQLEAANHELEAFTYSVSHDLRAPLRHIGGFSRILTEDFGPAMTPEARQHLKRIEEGTHRMGLLVDGLLNLARIGRHALKLQSISLNSVVEEAVSLLQPETEGRIICWRIAEFPFVECDPVLLKQVFQNLIDNALKFTRTRKRALIEIDHRQENGESVIAIRDNGVGFNMKYQDKLFGIFQRLHRTEDFEGTGIGLATVQSIVRKHGGRVWAEGELDKGATFYFTLGAVKSTETQFIEVTNQSAAAGA